LANWIVEAVENITQLVGYLVIVGIMVGGIIYTVYQFLKWRLSKKVS